MNGADVVPVCPPCHRSSDLGPLTNAQRPGVLYAMPPHLPCSRCGTRTTYRASASVRRVR